MITEKEIKSLGFYESAQGWRKGNLIADIKLIPSLHVLIKWLLQIKETGKYENN